MRKKTIIASLILAVIFLALLPFVARADIFGEIMDFFDGLFGSSPEKIPILKDTYTPSSETHCVDGKCIATYYPVIRFTDSKGTRIEDTYSLKDCEFKDSFGISINSDSNYPVKVLDYNYTTIILNTSITKNQVGKNIPLSIDGRIEKNISKSKEDSSVNILKVDDSIIGKTIKFGGNSTIIKLLPNSTNKVFYYNGYQTSSCTPSDSSTPTEYTSYQNINASDNTRWDYTATKTGTGWICITQRFFFDLTDANQTIASTNGNWSWMNFYWENYYTYASALTAYKDIYIKSGSSTWTDIGDMTWGSDGIFSYNTTAFSTYINASNITQFGTRLAGYRGSSGDMTIHIFTDYLNLTIGYEEGEAPPEDTTAPILNLVKAGSSYHEQNYTIRSRQSESYTEINISSNENVSVCFLEWNNGTKANYTMAIDSTKRYCSYNLTNQPSGIDYTFIVFANDTSNNWANYTWYKMNALNGGWNETKYARLNNTPSILDYQGSMYLYSAQGEYDKDYAGLYTKHILNHEQGIDGTNTDTGYLRSERDANANETVYCVAFVGLWFDDNITMSNTTVNNSYIHVWFEGDETGGNNSFGIGKEESNSPTQFTRNTTIWKDNISVTQDIYGTTYYLMSGLIDFEDSPLWFDENDIYDYGFKMRSGSGNGNPEIYNHKNASSFILINVPDNATLQGLDSDGDGVNDFSELYGNFTDPFYNDTDNDGVSDNCDNDPLQPSDTTDICQEPPPDTCTYDATNPCFPDWCMNIADNCVISSPESLPNNYVYVYGNTGTLTLTADIDCEGRIINATGYAIYQNGGYFK